MKYRIKKVTYDNGRIVYIPQVKRLFRWNTIDYFGYDSFFFSNKCSSENIAVTSINNHKEKHSKITNIEYESY